MSSRRPWPFIVVLLLLPLVAGANSGTPLVWATMMHLVFGNFLIGIGEGSLVALLLRSPLKQTIMIMIGANYFSAWVGWKLLDGGLAERLHPDVNTIRSFLLTIVIIAYLLTIVLEWPFVVGCAWRQRHRWWRGFWVSCVAQTASYGVLLGWYWIPSSIGASILRWHLVQSAQCVPCPGIELYYLGAGDGEVYCRDLATGSTKRVATAHSQAWHDELRWRPTPGHPDTRDLILLREASAANPDPGPVVLLPAYRDARTVYPAPEYPERDQWERHSSGRQVQILPGPASPRPAIEVGIYALEGLMFFSSASPPEMTAHFACELPFLNWYVRNATQLPDDRVVFQLGDDQICLLDPNRREYSLLARGHGPIAIQIPSP